MFFKQNNSFSQLTDDDLIERYRHSHDVKYAGNLYLRYTHLVLGLGLKYFKNETAAEDAVMDVFEVVARELKKHKIDNFKSWLFTVTKNHCLQELRKNKSVVKKQDSLEYFLNHSMENNEELHLMEQREKEALLVKLENALPKLKEEQQQCIRAFYLENKSYQNIADKFGMTTNDVKSNIQNGKRNLKIKLTEI